MENLTYKQLVKNRKRAVRIGKLSVIVAERTIGSHDKNTTLKEEPIIGASGFYDSCPKSYEGCRGAEDYGRFIFLCSRKYEKCNLLPKKKKFF